MAKHSFSCLTLLGTLLVTVIMHVAAAQEGFTREINFDIAAQSVEAALIEFSKQADVQVMVGGALSGQKTEGVKGKLSVSDGLRQLLKNTGLEYQAEGNTITIRSNRNARAEEKVRPLTEDTTLASSGAADEAARSSGRADEDTKAERRAQTLDEVVVTGTHIHGSGGAGSNVQVLSREDIDASGYATLQDFLTKALPQNYGGGPSEDFNTGTEGNFNAGTGVNLRGLGADATLVLINGRRQAVSGTQGAFVDVSSIPTSAIARVEILSDGASALYGSDAVGGVVNVILRDDLTGAESLARWGTANGGVAERSISQVMGTTWTGGNVIGGVQFNDRDALPRSARHRTASEDKRPFGGDDFRTFMTNPGNIIDLSTFAPAYAIPRDQDGSALTPALLAPGVNLQDYYRDGDLLPEQEMTSGFLEARQSITEQLSVSLDARYSHRVVEQKQFGVKSFLLVPDTNPFFVDPFGGFPFVMVAYSFVDDLGPLTGIGETDTLTTGVGATLRLHGDWSARFHADRAAEEMKWVGKNQVDFAALDAALADPNPATAFNPFGDGSHTNPATLNSIRVTQRERAESDIESANLVVDGSLFALRDRPAKLAVGADYREESLEMGATDPRTLGRNVFAAFGELSIPLFWSSADHGWRQRLELSAAARYEEYSDFGTSSNPKLGITWSPHEFVSIRGTWGTSFKAPKLVDLDEDGPGTGVSALLPFADPQSPSGQSLVLAVFGKNSKLKEETANAWTAGLDFRLWGRDKALSLTYYDIEFKDRISQGGPTGDPTAVLFQEAQWSDIIDRAPTPEGVQAICNGPNFAGDPSACTTTPPDLIVDFRLRNLAFVRTRGVDVQFAQELLTQRGTWQFTLNASRMLDFDRAVSPRAGSFDILDTVGNPMSLRLRGGLAWSRNGLSSNLFVNYDDDYKDDISQPNRRIGSWTTIDMRMGYTTRRTSSWFSGIDVALSVTNLTDKDPPFYNSLYGYDLANADLLGRFISAQVTKTW